MGASHVSDTIEDGMPRKRTVKLRCPICKKAVESKAPDFPFCSDRCRLIDLGAWLNEERTIQGESIQSADETPLSTDSPRSS